MKSREEFIEYVKALYNKFENTEEKKKRFEKLVSKFPQFLLKDHGIILGKACVFAYLTLYAFSDDPEPFKFEPKKFLVHFIDGTPTPLSTIELRYMDSLTRAYLVALAKVTGLQIVELERCIGLYDEETQTFIEITYQG